MPFVWSVKAETTGKIRKRLLNISKTRRERKENIAIYFIGIINQFLINIYTTLRVQKGTNYGNKQKWPNKWRFNQSRIDIHVVMVAKYITPRHLDLYWLHNHSYPVRYKSLTCCNFYHNSHPWVSIKESRTNCSW